MFKENKGIFLFNLFLFDFVKIYNIIIAIVIFKGNKKCTN